MPGRIPAFNVMWFGPLGKFHDIIDFLIKGPSLKTIFPFLVTMRKTRIPTGNSIKITEQKMNLFHANVAFLSPLNVMKISGFLMFSVVIEVEHWCKMEQRNFIDIS